MPFPIAIKEKKGHKRDRSISSKREAKSTHRHKRHSGQDPTQDPDQSGTDESVASGTVKAKKSTPSSGPKTSGGGSGFARKDPDSSAVSTEESGQPTSWYTTVIDSQRPGNGTVPESALAVETVDGRVAYEGTLEEEVRGLYYPF